MICKSAVDVASFYSPGVPEDEIRISTCHFNSFEGIHNSFKPLSATDYFCAQVGNHQLLSFVPE